MMQRPSQFTQFEAVIDVKHVGVPHRYVFEVTAWVPADDIDTGRAVDFQPRAGCRLTAVNGVPLAEPVWLTLEAADDFIANNREVWSGLSAGFHRLWAEQVQARAEAAADARSEAVD